MENKKVVNVGGIDVYEGMEIVFENVTEVNNVGVIVGFDNYDGYGAVVGLNGRRNFYRFDSSANNYLWRWVRPKEVGSTAEKGVEELNFGDEVRHRNGDIGRVDFVGDGEVIVSFDDGTASYLLDSCKDGYWGNYISKVGGGFAAEKQATKTTFRLETYLDEGIVHRVNGKYATAEELHAAANGYMLAGHTILFAGEVVQEFEYELKQEVRVKK